MKRMLVLAIVGTLMAAVTGLVIVMAEATKGPVFIPGDQPVTEEQIRQKLQADDWSVIQVVREGRYFEVTSVRDGQNVKIAVDSQTDRLRAEDNDDDDD